jgi:8-oxo-dGTP diphosphatase
VDHDCVMAILRDGGRVLMCHRHPAREWMPDVWDFPGGHIERGESPQQALGRELLEELGIVVAAPDRPADVVLESEAESVRLAVWFLDHDGPVENRCTEEHDELRWVTAEDARNLELADVSYRALIDQALHK